VSHARNVDGNQQLLVKAARSVGASVEHIHREGRGIPDLLVGWRRRNYLVEVKTLEGELNEVQQAWHAGWRGQVGIGRTPEEILRLIGAVR
jgi:hypothetical protein